MKIAMVHHEYTRGGGVERHSVEIAERLAARGHEVHYIGAVAREAPGPGVTFHKVSVPLKPNSLRMLSFALRAPARVSACACPVVISPCDLSRADVVVAQSCHAAGLAIPEAVEVRPKGKMNWGIADRIQLSLEKRIYSGRRYRKVVAVSHGVSEELQEWYRVPPEDIVVIPNGVDIEHFHPRSGQSAAGRIRSAYGISPADRILLFVGHEFRRKGLEIVLDALARLGPSPLHLLIAGDDDTAPYLAQARRMGIAGKLSFLGKVSDTAPLYAAADLFVFPTAYEAWPLVMMEAAASGLPLIMTRVNGVEEFLADGMNGFIVTSDPVDVAEKIALLLGDDRLRQRLGAQARLRSEAYSWEIIVDKFESLCGTLAGGDGRR
jgi:UDP-glucose:(heptosyl)LPS alpha-1,3-glucosyltransferase